ncbi:MAG TPA: methyltransferase domain-containing protein [Verrucomicrobiae bacterium]|jgi:2-polyprenyl-3-methyl-5-hydroxy-6-metoxy-1,4-benzoquinol methylase|nr:methyltransferase domain-containing protein [Verrucomicrobiae bacterium]
MAPPRFFDPACPELIDRPDTDPASVRQELAALEAINRRLGGHAFMVDYVRRSAHSFGLSSVRILDLGTGLADIPRAIAKWARRAGVAVSILAVDANPKVLTFARESCRDWPEIEFVQGDMAALDYGDSSFDLVLCSLALHHFEASAAVSILRGMEGVARRGYIVNDLRRNWAAIGLTHLLSRATGKNHLIRHDGPHSCRAAFTVPELCALAEQAGLKSYHIRKHSFMYLMALEGQKVG